MIETTGTVIAVDGDEALVQVNESGGCGRCHEEGGCGGHNLGKMLCAAPTTYRVRNPGGAAVGQQVTIALAEGVIRRSALLMYGLPLALLLAAALIGMAVAGEGGAMLGALAGLLGGWWGVRCLQRARRGDSHTEPFIKP